MPKRYLEGTVWVPNLALGEQTDTKLKVAPTVKNWSPKGDWEIYLEFFCSSTAALIHYNALLVFSKPTGSDGRCAVLSYDADGNLFWHDDIVDANDLTPQMAAAKAKIQIPGSIRPGYLHNVRLNYTHATKEFAVTVDSERVAHNRDASFESHAFDTVYVGRWLKASDKSYLGSVSGQLLEALFSDAKEPRNSRLYNTTLHSPNDRLPGVLPSSFINHLNPEDGRTFLSYSQGGDAPAHTALPSTWWVKADDKIIMLEGPDVIKDTGFYDYAISHSFEEPVDIMWSTNGTHLDQFRPITVLEKDSGGKDVWKYGCSFYIPSEKWLDTRVHLNATLANRGMISKIVADLREPEESHATPAPVMKCSLDAYAGRAIPSGTAAQQGTNTFTLDGFSLSNFDNTEALITFHISTTDKPSEVITKQQLSADAVTVTYNEIISDHYSFGNSTEILIEMEVTHDVYYADPIPVVARQYVFDKSQLHGE